MITAPLIISGLALLPSLAAAYVVYFVFQRRRRVQERDFRIMLAGARVKLRTATSMELFEVASRVAEASTKASRRGYLQNYTTELGVVRLMIDKARRRLDLEDTNK